MLGAAAVTVVCLFVCMFATIFHLSHVQYWTYDMILYLLISPT